MRTIKKLKKFTKFRPLVYSRHPSHDVLRTELSLLPFRSVIRLGSTTKHFRDRIECNNIQSIKNSASKLLMKQCFNQSAVKTAKWCKGTESFNVRDNGIEFVLGRNDHEEFNGIEFPIVVKHIYGSRGTGNHLLKTREEFETWLVNKTLSNYIFEKFYNYSREYRLHVSEEGCFYTCRKMLKSDTPEDHRWYRNDSNSSWIMEENLLFDKPSNWSNIVEECVKALKSVGLDIGGFDVKVQSAIKSSTGRDRENPEFIIIESNSACSFGDVTAKKYLEEIPKVLKRKYERNRI